MECISGNYDHNAVLFFFIYIVVWRSEAGGLNEIQQVGEDVFYYNMNLNISMRNVAVSVILLSTLGAVLDMALTVTTSVYEVKSHKEDMTFKELIHSGMQIGKEVTGTTVNTLLFAYLGESLLLFSYLRMQGYSFERWILCLFKSKKIAPCNRCHRHYNPAGDCSEDH